MENKLTRDEIIEDIAQEFIHLPYKHYDEFFDKAKEILEWLESLGWKRN